jgi:hypothetical protein
MDRTFPASQATIALAEVGVRSDSQLRNRLRSIRPTTQLQLAPPRWQIPTITAWVDDARDSEAIDGRWRQRYGKIACMAEPISHLCVPRTLSTSCDQAVFVDHATDASVPPDVVSLKIDRFG